MPKSNESINKDLEDLLVAKGYDVTALDSSGKEVPVADSADLFSFHFHRNGKDYGTVTATIDGLQKLTLYYDDEIAKSGNSDGDGEEGTSWFSLLKQLKKFAQRHQLGFVLKDTDRLRQDMKRRNHTKKLEESSNIYSGIGFSVRSDILWPSTIFESTQTEQFSEFSDWLEEQRSIQIEPRKNKKCILAMVVKSDNQTHLLYGTAIYIGQNQTHYLLKNSTGVHEYSKKNQLVFNSVKSFSKFEMLLSLKFHGGSDSLSVQKMPVMEARRSEFGLTTVLEGKVKELTIDLKDMTDEEFMKAYKMTKKEARAELKPKKMSEGLDSNQKRAGQLGPTEKVKNNNVGKLVGASESVDKGVAEGQEELKTYKRVSAGDAINRQNIANRTGVADPKIARRNAGQERAQRKLDRKISEGYYGNRKMSYSDDTPSVKMVIKHNKQLEETDQRFRHIEKIFLETSDGERFQVPTTKPSRARMFARHIAEGGGYKDDRWNHITEISEDLDKLGGFVRATNNKQQQFNESAQRMINEAVEQYGQLRETVKKLSSSRGYNKYFESYEPRVILEDDSDLSEAFRHSTLDTRIESALPTLSKFGIKMDRLAESDMFEQWADSLVDEALDPDTPRQVEALVELLADMIPVGPNAEVAIGELKDVIEDDELYARLRRTAVADPDSDARPQIIAWMQEQDDRKYREALDQIETDDSDSAEDQSKVKKQNKSDSEEPAKVQPKKKPTPPPGGDMGGLPPLPPLPGGDTGGLPPLSPLKEGDDVLASLVKLLGR